jgi:TonB family protein
MIVRLLLVVTVAVLAYGQDLQTHMARGLAQMKAYVPGVDSPENLGRARQAREEFEAAVRADGNSVIAVHWLAHSSYTLAQAVKDPAQKLQMLEDAEQWYRRLASLDSRSKVAPYSLGVIAWTKAYPQVMAARGKLGMKPEDPGPLPDAGMRNDLLGRVGPLIHDGIVQLETALAIDPEYGDAMAYMNLMHRLRADLGQGAEDYRRDIASADAWVQKALAAKRGIAEAVGVPRRIRVGSNVQAVKLIEAPKPEYPPSAREARIQGVVRFNVEIGESGTVKNVSLVSGHPLLVPPAVKAVQRYIYQPTLLNGTPVEVVTVVDVDFRLGDLP